MTSVPITPALLDDWLKAVEHAGASVARLAPPTAGGAALPSGRPTPPELQTVWAWRSFPRGGVELAREICVLGPAEAEQETADLRQAQLQIYEGEPPVHWRDSYLLWSIVNRIWLLVDLDELGPTSKVYLVADATFEEEPALVAESIGELITHVTARIDSGDEYFDGWWRSRGASPRYPI